MARHTIAFVQKPFDEILVVPTAGGLGAEIRGVDLRRLDRDSFATIYRAFTARIVA
jgi:hypothetical protein